MQRIQIPITPFYSITHPIGWYKTGKMNAPASSGWGVVFHVCKLFTLFIHVYLRHETAAQLPQASDYYSPRVTRQGNY